MAEVVIVVALFESWSVTGDLESSKKDVVAPLMGETTDGMTGIVRMII